MDTIIYSPVSRENATHYTMGYDLFLIEKILQHFSHDKFVFLPDPKTPKKYFDALKESLSDNARFVFGGLMNRLELFQEAKILITDSSRIAFSYSFSTLRPSLFYSAYNLNLDPNSDQRFCIGLVASNLKDVIEKTQLLLNQTEDYRDKINSYIFEGLYNIQYKKN